MTDESLTMAHVDEHLKRTIEEGDIDPHDDALFAALIRVMASDERANMLFGNIHRGEAEDHAANIAAAKYSLSPVLWEYENMVLMARRAEGADFLHRILDAIKAIGRKDDPKPGVMSRIKHKVMGVTP